MNSKYAISIIIPMFNVSSYIRQCAISLFSQKKSSIQFVFIDDGSTDNGVELLTILIEQNFSHLKDDIIIINLETNEGVANARNVGISHALGEYIGFVDADDWVELNMFSELYESARGSNADIIGCNFINEYSEGCSVFNQKFSSDKYIYVSRLLTGEIFPSLCTEIVKRELYTMNNIYFEVGLNMGEDLLINVKLLILSHKLSFVDKPFYHYRHSQDSSCVIKSLNSVKSDIRVADLIEKYLEKLHLDTRFKYEINYRKFFSKLPYWTIKEYRDVVFWRNLYMESNKYVFLYKQLDWKMKFEYWLALHHASYLAKFFVFLLKFQRVIRTYVLSKA